MFVKDCIRNLNINFLRNLISIYGVRNYENIAKIVFYGPVRVRYNRNFLENLL